MELEEKREGIGIKVQGIDRDLERIRAKEGRLGIAVADGTIKEGLYKLKLQQLKQQEAILLICRQNIDPAALTELADLDERINSRLAASTKSERYQWLCSLEPMYYCCYNRTNDKQDKNKISIS